MRFEIYQCTHIYPDFHSHSLYKLTLIIFVRSKNKNGKHNVCRNILSCIKRVRKNGRGRNFLLTFLIQLRLSLNVQNIYIFWLQYSYPYRCLGHKHLLLYNGWLQWLNNRHYFQISTHFSNFNLNYLSIIR